MGGASPKTGKAHCAARGWTRRDSAPSLSWASLASAVSMRITSSVACFAALGLSLATLGPGAWSVDARLFGRKRIV